MRIHSEPQGNLEFQIAPMVDVIFILILFFHVLSRRYQGRE